MDTQKNKLSRPSDAYICTYCKRSFSKEKSLVSHLCEQKRRHQQKDEKGVSLGFQGYLRFYEVTQNSQNKTYEDFAASPYYLAFVKFGRYCIDIRCINYINFLNWLLNNNKKLDHWCSDKLYTEWSKDYIKYEAVQDALERALTEMQKYAADNPELKNGFSDYFRYGNTNRILHHIATARISPWVVYNCVSGVEFLDKLTEDQVNIIIMYIDPTFWQRKFRDYDDDVDWVKLILKAANL